MVYGNFCRFERMQSKYSPVDELFINHRHDLIKTLTKNPWEIASTLLMEGLISLTVMHKIKIQVYTHSYKASLLMKDLQEKLRGCDPQMFHQLLDILLTYGLSEALVSNLRKYHHARGKVVRECTCAGNAALSFTSPFANTCINKDTFTITHPMLNNRAYTYVIFL